MIEIYWSAKNQKWLSKKTGGIIDPVKAGMYVDTELCDKGWEIELRKLGFKNTTVPYSELRKVVK